MLAHALRLRCPICGSQGIWRAYGQLHKHCPGCGYRFERESGYWVGGLIVNLAVAMLAFFVVLVGGFIVYGAALPVWIQWSAGGLMILLPMLGYPWSKTLWMASDLKMNPDRTEETPGGTDGI